MTRFSFTGPSELSREQEAEVAARLPSICARGTEFSTGGAAGFDVLAARVLVRAFPAARHRVIVPRAPYDRAAVESLKELCGSAGISFEVYHPASPAGATAYRRRNEALVRAGDILVAGLLSPDFYRSGEWMTVNIAKRAGVPVSVISL